MFTLRACYCRGRSTKIMRPMQHKIWRPTVGAVSWQLGFWPQNIWSRYFIWISGTRPFGGKLETWENEYWALAEWSCQWTPEIFEEKLAPVPRMLHELPWHRTPYLREIDSLSVGWPERQGLATDGLQPALHIIRYLNVCDKEAGSGHTSSDWPEPLSIAGDTTASLLQM
jgi:hypothetical protein